MPPPTVEDLLPILHDLTQACTNLAQTTRAVTTGVRVFAMGGGGDPNTDPMEELRDALQTARQELQDVRDELVAVRTALQGLR